MSWLLYKLITSDLKLKRTNQYGKNVKPVSIKT